jgi:hypothetical protein
VAGHRPTSGESESPLARPDPAINWLEKSIDKISARCGKGELSVSFEMDSSITEEPRRFGVPADNAPSIRLRGLSPVGSA